MKEVPRMSRTINALVDEATRHLATLCYSKSSNSLYHAVWRRFTDFCIENGQVIPDRKNGNEFLAQTVFPANAVLSYKQQQNRIVMCLFDLAENGSFPLATGKLRIPLPGYHGEVYDEYTLYLQSKGFLCERTIYGKKHFLKKFLNFLEMQGIFDIDTLKAKDVYDYLSSSLGSVAATTRASHLYFLREFLRFLVDAHDLTPSLAELFPVILVNSDAVLPSVYEVHELRGVIAAHDSLSRCSRRNRAIVLLALQLGMRASDIRTLHISQIDWRNRRLSFLQFKTKRTITLPLPEESMFAILDYMKNERPDSDSPNLFLRSSAPYGPVVATNTFHQIIAACFKRAGIDTRGKHYGLHSLRHSTAVNMLMTNTPYHALAGVLGHVSANTTKTYLKTDYEHLRCLSLEVPHEC